MKIQIIFLILLIVLGIYSLQAQVTQEWVQGYNGTANSSDSAKSVAVDDSGNVYETGSSMGSGTGSDYATIKYNSSGVRQWIQIYNGPGNSFDGATSLAVDDSGNVYVTGSSEGSGTGSDYATIKYNSSGVLQWIQRYSGQGNNNENARTLALDNSGNVYISGSGTGSGTGFDCATIKYNSSGVQLWIQIYNGPGNGNDITSSLKVDASGNVHVTGYSVGSGTGSDYVTIKYNSSGVQYWVQRYNGSVNGCDRAYSLTVDDTGNVYVTGYSDGGGFNYDYATIKYNSSGIWQWVQRYGPALDISNIGYTLTNTLEVDSSGNVFVTGTGLSTDRGCCSGYATIKYNSSGVRLWVQIYYGGAELNGVASSLATDNLGNVYITGSGGVSEYYATIKYNSSGVQQWAQIYNGPGTGSHRPSSLAVDNSGNVYVTGQSNGSASGYDYATVKYSQSTGVSQTSNTIPEKFSLSQNYPNPFNPNTVISYDLSVSSFASLRIYDVLGNEVVRLVNEQQSAGSYSVDFDGNNFPSGIYFYRLQTDNFSETKKMTLIK